MNTLHVDPFSSENIAHPQLFQNILQEAGPVVWLSQYNIYATGRFDIAKKILGNPENFISGEGVGLMDERGSSGILNASGSGAAISSTNLPERTPLVEMDGAAHGMSRRIAEGVLGAPTIKSIITDSITVTQHLLGPLIEKGRFDVIGDLVVPVVLKAFPDAYGVVPEGRKNLLSIAELALNSLGPRNENFRRSAAQAPLLKQWMRSALLVENMDDDKIARRLYGRARSAGIGASEAHSLIRAVLISAIDTTVAGISNTLYCLTKQPEHWLKLQRHPELAVKIFEEAVRLEAPVQMCYRQVASNCELEGIPLQEGARIMVHLGTANRDPLTFFEPHRFDINRSSQTALTFGSGVHRCLGHALARGQAVGILQAIASKVKHIGCEETVHFVENNTLRRPAALVIRVSPVATAFS